MNIKTKFNVGETAYTIDKRTLKVREFEVGIVVACANEDSISIKYKAKGDSPFADDYDEGVCFGTRNELLAYINAE